jgi:hypothetical protein
VNLFEQIPVDTPKRRSTAAKKLKDALISDAETVKNELRYYVKLPPRDSHCNHLVGEVCVSFKHMNNITRLTVYGMFNVMRGNVITMLTF